MDYKIGEVSKILNISKEMIRYYEKKGAIHPNRKSDNNYRTYSTMDVFLLMEINRYQALNFSVKEISKLLQDNYMEHYVNHLREYTKEIEKEISFKQLLKQRVKELADRATYSQLNIGNFWFKKIPEHDLLYMLKANNDHYDDFELTKKNRQIIFNDNNMAFFESFVIFEEKYETWWYGIQSEYSKALELKYEDFQVLPSQVCLCTHIDMGEIGDFDRSCLIPIYQHIEKNGYTVSGKARGIIIGRGYNHERFQRIMEIQIPIEIETLK